MFDSGVTAQGLIEEVERDIDAALPFDIGVYLDSVNSLQILLYSEIIQNRVRTSIDSAQFNTIEGQPNDNYISLSGKAFRYEDVFSVYAVTGGGELDRVQLIDATALNGVVFPYTYYKYGENLAFNIPQSTDDYPEEAAPEYPEVSRLDIVHLEIPERLTADNYNSINIAVPAEFIDLVKAKVRGDIYRLANEGDAASDWLSYYNVLLENFRAWIEQRKPALGN